MYYIVRKTVEVTLLEDNNVLIHDFFEQNEDVLSMISIHPFSEVNYFTKNMDNENHISRYRVTYEHNNIAYRKHCLKNPIL